jgi:RHH-type proline utilization regulon transcriptional repressor/proline dehydrogenase/delta 1-pyrroline-5-carboxylate dehydrogenase
MIEMIAGSARELKVGDPREPDTHIGPVIDAEAKERLERHIAAMKASATVRYAPPSPLAGEGREGGQPGQASAVSNAPADAISSPASLLPTPSTPPSSTLPRKGGGGHGDLYVHPHIFELPKPEALAEEVFGPVLHVVRYRADRLDSLLDAIETSGYGLTLGVHSRIDDTVERIVERLSVGNVYVNRNMIGAVVGVQPFGGHGLSGTGPKAGGPHYLLRFATEQTVTINTAAAGGNASLIAMGE